MTLSIGYVGLVSRTDEDNAAMAAFFADVLDLPVEGDAAEGYAEVKAGDVTIALHRGAMVDVKPLGGLLLQFACDDVDSEAAAVTSRGGDLAVAPTNTDWGTRHAYVRGPQGLLVELYQ